MSYRIGCRFGDVLTMLLVLFLSRILVTQFSPIFFFQTGWGTRAGIGDASAATAALDAQDKIQEEEKHHGYPQSGAAQRQRQSYGGGEALTSPPEPSPFRDQPSPYRDFPSPSPDSSAAGANGYATRHTGRKESVSHQRRRGGDDEVEMQVGFAR